MGATPKRIAALETCEEHSWGVLTVLKAPNWPSGTKTIVGMDAMGSQLHLRYSRHRKGQGDVAELEDRDVLMRLDHSGDCFSRYAVFRNGVRLDKGWWSYEGVGRLVGNATDAVLDAAELPRFL